MTSPTTVTVDLGSRTYDIIIGEGVLEQLEKYLQPILGHGKVHIVSDETVWALHGKHFLDMVATRTILPPGEGQKNFITLQTVLDDMFAAGLSRKDTVFAFGGGVIGDLTGFAASVYKRGCQFVQVPTTLLAQVDSSVGGKTAINVPQGKNLVGAFYQPKLVLTDTSVLQTLPERELKAGYAEVLKYGLLGDAAFFEWLEANGADVLSLNPGAIAKAIAVSCETKAKIVAEDEREQGVRALLNLGHTFGHALEAEAGYDGSLLHGEGVSVGMEMAFEFSAQIGLCSKDDVTCMRKHLKSTSMPTLSSVSRLLNPERLLRHMGQDKKNEGGNLTLILARGIGDAFVQKNVPHEDVLTYLTDVTQRYA